jgi:hypothetical protein
MNVRRTVAVAALALVALAWAWAPTPAQAGAVVHTRGAYHRAAYHRGVHNPANHRAHYRQHRGYGARRYVAPWRVHAPRRVVVRPRCP